METASAPGSEGRRKGLEKGPLGRRARPLGRELSAEAAITKHHGRVALQQCVSSQRWRPGVQDQGDSACISHESSMRTLPGSRVSTFWLCAHMAVSESELVEGGRGRERVRLG